MKSVMIINEEPKTIHELKSFIDEEEVEIIDASNSRIGLHRLNKEDNIHLILVKTHYPESVDEAFFSFAPKSNLSIDATDEKQFLKKPFTKDQFKSFIDNMIK